MQLEERVKKLATKTHKDRVHEFNSKLEALSEHHDIPKVSKPLLVRSASLLISPSSRLDQAKTSGTFEDIRHPCVAVVIGGILLSLPGPGAALPQIIVEIL